MQRMSDKWIIFKKDITKSVILKNYKKYVEYWIYQPKELQLLLPNGKPARDYTNLSLQAIIVTDADDTVEEHEKAILVRGIKFTKQHLFDYLSKTRRTA